MESPLPEFEKPPVIEVVCGVTFKALKSLLAPHLGLLWEKFRADYPRCQEVPPLTPVFERFDSPGQPTVQLELSDLPPLPRTWFVQSTENGIVQVQRDRFLHNWKKVRPEDQYPRYNSVIQMFRERLVLFETFLKESELGNIEPLQYELTYVNHMLRGREWSSLADIGSLFPDSTWRTLEGRFLPTPEAVNWRTTFVLPDQVGRLHATIRSGMRKPDDTPILVCELTARGMPKDTSREAMWDWFDLGHEWIVRGFADLTGESVQEKAWSRTR